MTPGPLFPAGLMSGAGTPAEGPQHHYLAAGVAPHQVMTGKIDRGRSRETGVRLVDGL